MSPIADVLQLIVDYHHLIQSSFLADLLNLNIACYKHVSMLAPPEYAEYLAKMVAPCILILLRTGFTWF